MVDITLQQMMFFIGVAENKSFSSASKNMLYSQPAISRGIQRLEDIVGVKLFNRTQKGVELTDQGEFLYSEWKPIINRILFSLEQVNSITRSDDHELRIQSCESPRIIRMVTEAKRRFKSRHPDMIVKYDIYEHREMCKRIIVSNISLCFSYTLPMPDMPIDNAKETFAFWESEQIEATILKDLGSYIFTSEDNPKANENCSLADMKEQRLLLHSNMELEDSAIVQLAHLPPVSEPFGPIAECKRAGFYPKIQFLPNLASVLNAAFTNDDCYFVMGDIWGDSMIRGIKKYPIKEPTEQHYAIAVWRKDMLTDHEKEFLSIVKEVSNEL